MIANIESFRKEAQKIQYQIEPLFLKKTVLDKGVAEGKIYTIPASIPDYFAQVKVYDTEKIQAHFGKPFNEISDKELTEFTKTGDCVLKEGIHT